MSITLRAAAPPDPFDVILKRNAKQKMGMGGLTYYWFDTPKGEAILSWYDSSYKGSHEFTIEYLMATARGAGRELMEGVVDLADRYKVTLVLTPRPIRNNDQNYTPKLAQLVRFYKSFGFVGGSGKMTRTPK